MEKASELLRRGRGLCDEEEYRLCPCDGDAVFPGGGLRSRRGVSFLFGQFCFFWSIGFYPQIFQRFPLLFLWILLFPGGIVVRVQQPGKFF